MLLKELADYLKADLYLPEGAKASDLVIQKVSPIEDAKEGEVTFIANPEYAKFAKTTKASALIVGEKYPDCIKPQLIHKNPYLAFAKTAQLFYRPHRGPTGIADTAFIAADAKIGDGVTIYPFVFIGSRAEIADGVVLFSGVSLGDDVKVGRGSVLYPNVVVYEGCEIGERVIIHAGSVIGGDGFGYAIGENEIVKIPQVGNVILEDEVELGASCSVDRAAMGSTRIGKGTKLDSKVQIGHNCEVGQNCMLSALTGLAGSCKIGDWVIMGGHSGVNGHIEIKDHSKIGAMTGVVKSIDKSGSYVGFPAINASQWRRQQVYFKKLADYERRLRDLEQKFEV